VSPQPQQFVLSFDGESTDCSWTNCDSWDSNWKNSSHQIQWDHRSQGRANFADGTGFQVLMNSRWVYKLTSTKWQVLVPFVVM
jgi:hypothetical protein